MSFARPSAADEPKQYIIVNGHVNSKADEEKYEQAINQKLAEGWHLQGGIGGNTNYPEQAMVK